jgi:hypothetical protein
VLTDASINSSASVEVAASATSASARTESTPKTKGDMTSIQDHVVVGGGGKPQGETQRHAMTH